MLGEVEPAGVGGAQGVDGEEHRPVTLLLQITLLHRAGTVVHTLQSTDLHIDSEGPQGVQVDEVRGGGGGVSLLHGGL